MVCIDFDVEGKETIEMLHEFLWEAPDQVQTHSNVRSTHPPYLEAPFLSLEDPTAYISLYSNFKYKFIAQTGKLNHFFGNEDIALIGFLTKVVQFGLKFM